MSTLTRFVENPYPSRSQESAGNERPRQSTPPETGDRTLHVKFARLQERLRQQRQEGQVEERQRIARELHDGVLSELCSLSMVTDLVAEQVREAASEEPRLLDLFHEVNERLDASIDDLRRIAHGHRAKGPGSDLSRALNRFVMRAAPKDRPSCTYEQEGHLPPVDDESSRQLYRIAQEAVTNAVKHADAGRITVRLIGTATALRLSIIDDGKGMVRTDKRPGTGLSSMRWRAAQIGADFSVTTNHHEGTTVTCTWTATLEDSPDGAGITSS